MRIVRSLDYPPAASTPPSRSLSSEGGWEALIREQEIIEIYFWLERASQKDQGLNNVSETKAFNFIFNIEI